MGPGDEAHSVEVFEELCGVCRGQGSMQDAPQQLSDLAELMHSYGFPTPGWGEGEGPGRPDSLANAASGLEQVRWMTEVHDPCSQLCICKREHVQDPAYDVVMHSLAMIGPDAIML